ncbi:MAG: zf-HC2 domain-containing protein [Elusimicrobia bacterium]|nr:zf-HC2 domain-containing protein [Candidatus Obscuribacterium magneticum]MCB4755848.1 zf-HC2 domain-containing protein [Candidatus Obscuribacterium magneticum]
MDHDQIKDKLDAYDDNELSIGERHEVTAHLEACAECRTNAEEWKKTTDMFFKTPQLPSSEEFVHRVMARIERLEPADVREQGGLRRALNRWFYPAFVGAAVAGFLFIMTVPMPEPKAPLDSLLFEYKAENIPSDWLVSADVAREDQILRYVMGEI